MIGDWGNEPGVPKKKPKNAVKKLTCRLAPKKGPAAFASEAQRISRLTFSPEFSDK